MHTRAVQCKLQQVCALVTHCTSLAFDTSDVCGIVCDVCPLKPPLLRLCVLVTHYKQLIFDASGVCGIVCDTCPLNLHCGECVYWRHTKYK